MIRGLSVFFVALVISHAKGVEAYDSNNVHPLISERALLTSPSDSFFKTTLGFHNGMKEVLLGREVKEWLKDGARLEDETNCRSRNHFHDPLKTWDSAGLSNSVIDSYCLGTGESMTVDSSAIWAQKQAGFMYSINEWSWPKARDYYHKGLTSSARGIREDNLARSFRALGQVMHLIADASVPAHVRNDIHVFPYTVPWIGATVGRATYESWAQNNWRRLNYPARRVDPSIFESAAADVSAEIPISALWDQDQYNGTNPSVTWVSVAGVSGIGLAEFTNANFFSEDTIFRNYPHPAKDNTTAKLVEVTARDGKKEKVWYVQGYTSQCLAAYSYLWNFDSLIPRKEWLYNLDDSVYEDYASQLIPRAIGYSAALLDYFFRGTLEITPPDAYVYSITDGGKTPYTYSYVDENGNPGESRHQEFSHIRAKLRNTTVRSRDVSGNVVAYEEMGTGEIRALARYRVRRDYRADLSQEPPSAELRAKEFSYSVSRPVVISSLSFAKPTEFVFDFTDSPIPAGITDLYLQVVFKGTLGKEKDMAVAMGVKDLLEPTHLAVWNLTDMFSLNAGLYTSSEIRNSAGLASIVDIDGDAVFNEPGEPYIDPYVMDFEIGFAASAEPQNPVVTTAGVLLPPGRHMRLVVLVDDAQEGHYLSSMVSSSVDLSHRVFSAFRAVKSQEEGGAFQTSVPVESFRSVRQHYYMGIVKCTPMATDPASGTRYCPYSDQQAIPADPTPYPVTILFH